VRDLLKRALYPNALQETITTNGVILRFCVVKSIVRKLYRLLPLGFRSSVGGSLLGRVKANRLASTSKRLDLCAAQIAHVFHYAGFAESRPLSDKVCLEIGSGWVLSHAVVFHLLGAKSVVATDIAPNAYPSSLYRAIHGSVISIVRDILSPFEDHDKLRSRLDGLLRIRRFSFDSLKDLGVEYAAPIDMAQRPLGRAVDFIFSTSVLQHVPADDVLPLLRHLAGDLTEGGKMIHCVHLQDHRDTANAPFDFLSVPAGTYTRDLQSSRGNRIRRSGWMDILSHVDGMDFKIVYEWLRRDRGLPSRIDPSVHYEDERDLRTSHIGILGVKKQEKSGNSRLH
jgi:hypothetical protein